MTARRLWRLWRATAAAYMQRELAFRANFLSRCALHVIWLATAVTFYAVVYHHTPRIGTWSAPAYECLLGTFLALNATINAFVLPSCARVPEMIRTGDLDFALILPVDPQWQLTMGQVDWSLVPQILLGFGLVLHGASALGCMTFGRALAYTLAFSASLGVLYGLVVFLVAASVATTRFDSFGDVWFLLLEFGRCPGDLYPQQGTGLALSVLLTYVVPILAAVNVPARLAAGFTDSPWQILALAGAAAMLLALSRRALWWALLRYQSAGG